jgi:hypothetical protein
MAAVPSQRSVISSLHDSGMTGSSITASLQFAERKRQELNGTGKLARTLMEKWINIQQLFGGYFAGGMQ